LSKGYLVIVAKRPLLRVIAALASSVLIIFLISVVNGGPKAAPDFECENSGGDRVSIDISSGETGSQIAQELFEKGVVKSSQAFFRVAVSDSRSQSIAPGSHLIDLEICATEALDQLLDKDRIAGLIPIIEGMRASEVKKFFLAAGYSAQEVESAFKNLAIRKPFTTIEGLLFPAQYSFASGTKVADALKVMTDRAYAEIESAGLQPGKGRYDVAQLLVIASIVQAEGEDQDFGKVSRVIFNRLKIGMPLQMDSTVHYVLGSRGDIFLSSKSTKIKSPYNTYQNYGLPPAPIGNPGRNALDAVASPEAGDWLYFITVAPGDTRFTSSFDTFNEWKVLYKANLRAGKFEAKK
jgi:UPF0755 protein